MITQHQQSGIYLTCLGVGMGNYKDSKLEILAKRAMVILPTSTMKKRPRKYW